VKYWASSEREEDHGIRGRNGNQSGGAVISEAEENGTTDQTDKNLPESRVCDLIPSAAAMGWNIRVDRFDPWFLFP
jgi:hypothetical protein